MQLVHSRFVNVAAWVDGQTIQFRNHIAMVPDEIAVKLSARDGYTLTDRMKYKTAQRVLIVRSQGIGDVLFCTVVPKFLKRVNPDCHITFACFERNRRCLENNPNIDEIIEIPTSPEGWTGYDWVGNFQGFFEDPMSGRENLAVQNDMHRVDMLRRYFCLEPGEDDFKHWSDEIDYFVTDEEKEWAKARLKVFHMKHIIAYFPQASETTRRHPQNTQIIKHLASLGYGVVVMSPGGETVDGKNIENMAGRTSVSQMGAIIDAAALVIAPDTGPLHMAGALGKKIVTFFNSFPPKTRVAYYKKCFAFYPRESCPRMPCNYSQCPAPCFLTITPEMIGRKVDEMLGVKR